VNALLEIISEIVTSVSLKKASTAQSKKEHKRAILWVLVSVTVVFAMAIYGIYWLLNN
jgi:hypothetical protein